MNSKIFKNGLTRLLVLVMFFSILVPSKIMRAESEATMKDGLYGISVEFRGEDNTTVCLENDLIKCANLYIENGLGKLRIELQPLTEEGKLIYAEEVTKLKDVKVIDGSVVQFSYDSYHKVLDTYKDVIDKYNSEDGVNPDFLYPRIVEFNVNLNESPIYMEIARYIPENDYVGAQYIGLHLDWNAAVRIDAQEINSQIGLAEALDKNDYTKESYSKVVQAVEAVKAQMEPTIIDAKKLSDARGKLKKAMNELKHVSYSINYVLNNSKNSKSNPKSFTSVNQVSLKNPVKTGYIFGGWYTSKSYKTKITKIPKGTKKNITVYAKWIKVTVGKTKITSAKSNTVKKATLKWSKVTGAKGYEVIYSRYKNFPAKKYKKVTSKYSTLTFKASASKVKYYAKVRAYKLDSAGKKVYGPYSKLYGVKIK